MSSRKPGRAAAVASMAAMVWLGGTALGAARAAEEPLVEGRIVVRIDGEEIYESDDPDEETRDIYPRINSDLVFNLGHGFQIFNVLDFKERQDLEPGEKRFFEDLGLIVEEIGLRYRGDGWMVQAGKLHPNFGRGYDDAPGLFGDDFAKDYEIEEVWGAGFSVDLPFAPAILGEVALSGSVFMADRTVLAGSYFSEREVDQLEDGGPANTEWPESFTLALDGGGGRYAPGFEWHVGLTHRASGEGDEGSELGFVVAASQKLDLGGDFELYVMGELAHFLDYEGSEDDATFATAGTQLSWQGFFASAAVSGIEFDAADGDDRVDHLVTFDLGHEWRIGRSRFSIAGAWVAAEEKDVDYQGYGFRIRYRLPI